jgi:hypothetical protein
MSLKKSLTYSLFVMLIILVIVLPLQAPKVKANPSTIGTNTDECKLYSYRLGMETQLKATL